MGVLRGNLLGVPRSPGLCDIRSHLQEEIRRSKYHLSEGKVDLVQTPLVGLLTEGGFQELPQNRVRRRNNPEFDHVQ